MSLINLESLAAVSARHPKPDGFQPSYGTAGFRHHAHMLDSTLFRCGILAGLRAVQTGQAVGLMVTASHNPAEDNGVKLVEPSGEMLVPEWEAFATCLALAEDTPALAQAVSHVVDAGNIRAREQAAQAVVIGWDTRPSSLALVSAAYDGVQLTHIQPEQIGPCTTPMLHYAVRARNLGLDGSEAAYFGALEAGTAALLAGTLGPPGILAGNRHEEHSELLVDCANGVGAVALQQLLPRVAQLGIRLRLLNTGDGELNHLCGSDYVQKQRCLPAGFPSQLPHNTRCCALDGDADRIVFFTTSETGVQLLDGDRIATLLCVFIADALRDMPEHGISVGVVQTAYANGASTSYLRDTLGLQVVLAKTGVKHLHPCAKEFDIGVYFEANGHGTILFSDKVQAAIAQSHDSRGARHLEALLQVVNQAVGDALSGVLMVEAVLRCKRWSFADWAALYEDLPSRQCTLLVEDRSVIATTNAETLCVAPAGLQAEIDAAVSRYNCGRAFVRPSGTEDLVRVYAEAATRQHCDALALEVLRLVHRFAAGKGESPTSL